MGADEIPIKGRIAGVGRNEFIIKATQQRLVLIEAVVAIIAGYFLASMMPPEISNSVMFPFLKGAGLSSLDQAEKRDTGKGEFWFAVITRKGGRTAESLPGIIDTAMKALPWPKSMKWGSGTMQWVRPMPVRHCR